MDINHDVISFTSKNLYFKKVGVAIFADIIKTVAIFKKKKINDSRKVKIIRNYVSKYNIYLIS